MLYQPPTDSDSVMGIVSEPPTLEQDKAQEVKELKALVSMMHNADLDPQAGSLNGEMPAHLLVPLIHKSDADRLDRGLYQ